MNTTNDGSKLMEHLRQLLAAARLAYESCPRRFNRKSADLADRCNALMWRLQEMEEQERAAQNQVNEPKP